METPSSNSKNNPEKGISVLWITVVVLIGIIFRCIAWANSMIVDPDSTLYIHQAKALYYHQWNLLTNCGLSYISNYPILIAAGYHIIPNWEICGRTISFFFGTAVLIPLYLTLRCFLDRNISTLTTLVFAVLPLLVDRSVDVLRDATYWFFIVSGLYFFVARIKQENGLFLILSSLSFLMAAWARIEAVLFFAVSFLYLLSSHRKLRNMLIFAMPVLVLALLVFMSALITDFPIKSLHRGGEIFDKLSGSVHQYQNLRNDLKILAETQQNDSLNFFISKARSNIWLIALGVLMNQLLEASFYIFFVIFVIGISDVRKKIKEDQLLIYFAILGISALIMLYIHIVQTWIMDYRFMAVFLFPCAIFIGFGIEKIVRWLQIKFSLKVSWALLIIASLIVISTVPKNITHKSPDKLVFKQIGEMIAKREGNQKIIPISASHGTQRWISFYANLHYKGAYCPEPTEENCWKFFSKDRITFVQDLKEKNIKYFLWTQRQWPKEYDLFKMPYYRNLQELGRWNHPDTGWMILFEVL
ncbi:MAG: glycosyltransferase family 39 protein [Syntrophaceae bacterium]